MQSNQINASETRASKWAKFAPAWWICWGIVVPLIALIAERVTEICARTFFDPTPTGWHFILIALVPLTNCLGELLMREQIAHRLPWINKTLLKWASGVAMGISGFYTAWFLPITLLAVVVAIPAAFLFALFVVAGIPCMIFDLLSSSSEQLPQKLNWILDAFGRAVVCGGSLLLPFAPFMSFLACIRTYLSLTGEKTEDHMLAISHALSENDASVGTPNPDPIALERGIYLLILGAPFILCILAAFLMLLVPMIQAGFASGIWRLFAWVLFVLMAAAFCPGFYTRTKGNSSPPPHLPLDPAAWPMFVGLVLIFLADVPSTATRVAVTMAETSKTAPQALLILRAFANDDTLLRMCYEKSRATDAVGAMLNTGDSEPMQKAREIYYRVTGRAFNSSTIPASFRGKNPEFYDWQSGTDDVFDSDAGLASDEVGGSVRGVILDRSEIKGSIDACGTAASVNWTLEFENNSPFRREARAQILLPPTSVVSSAILWINGVPQKAAFGSRTSTRAAYQAVVLKKRDPLLVTTCGPDRVLIQCFPVPPNGKMLVQLGITTPLLVDSSPTSYLPMPVIIERNFQIAKHSIVITGKSGMSAPSGLLKAQQNNLFGSVSNQDLTAGKATIAVGRNAACHHIWCHDSTNDDFCISLLVAKVPAVKPKNLVIVVDGSAAMAEDKDRIAKMLAVAPKGINLSLLRAGDAVETLAKNVTSSSDPAWKQALEALKLQTFVGGQDDSAALISALDLLGPGGQGVVLWLHGPQPVKLQDPTVLAQRLAPRAQNVSLYELQMENGPNRTAEALDDMENVKRLPIALSPEHTLEHLFAVWSGTSADFQPFMTRENLLGMPLSSTVSEDSVDLTPLWANQQIAAIRRRGDKTECPAAVDLAKRYAVVTPVSGAVVLEKEDDYKRFGLTPPTDPNAHYSQQSNLPPGELSSRSTVSAVPEPSDWLLLFCAAVFGLIYFRKSLATHRI